MSRNDRPLDPMTQRLADELEGAISSQVMPIVDLEHDRELRQARLAFPPRADVSEETAQPPVGGPVTVDRPARPAPPLRARPPYKNRGFRSRRLKIPWQPGRSWGTNPAEPPPGAWQGVGRLTHRRFDIDDDLWNHMTIELARRPKG